MKKLLTVILSVFLIFPVAACVNTGSRGNSQNLTFLHIWPEHSTTIKSIIDDFMIENPDIVVEIIESNYSDVDRTLQNLYGTPEMPDVFFYWTHQMSKWVVDEVAMDISDVVAEVKPDLVADGVPAEVGKIDGKYYNMPFRATGFVVVYNKTMLDGFGMTVPTCLEDFEQLVKNLSQKQVNGSRVVPLAAYGGDLGTIYQLNSAFSTFVSIQTGAVEDVNYRTGRLDSNAEDLELAAKCVMKNKAWLDAGYFGSYSSRESVQQAFMLGSAAMAILNNNDFGILQEQMEGVELGVFGIPAPRALPGIKFVYGGFDGFAVNNYTDKAEQAKKLLKFLVSEEVQEKFANAEQGIVVNKNVTYDNSATAAIAVEMENVGKYDSQPDYNSGSYGQQNSDLLAAFFAKQSVTLAEAISMEEQFKANITKALADRQLNPVEVGWITPTYSRKTFDDSWLD